MTSESARRGAFICQECYATSFDTEPEAVKHENTYGHSTVWSPATPLPKRRSDIMTLEDIREAALTVSCPTCGVRAKQECTARDGIKERPHYARYELAVAPAVDEAVQEFAEPEPETRLVSLTCSAPANSRDPRRFTLLIEDEEANTVMAFDMDEHRFCLLMSHHVVKLEVS